MFLLILAIIIIILVLLLIVKAIFGFLDIVGNALDVVGNTLESIGGDSRLNSLVSDERFKNCKVFDRYISSKIIISENGFIGILDKHNTEKKIFHINNVNRYELVSIDEPIINYGLLSDTTAGKSINHMSLKFFMNDFNKPIIKATLILNEKIDIDSLEYENIQDETSEIFGTLDYLKKKYTLNKSEA